MGARHRDPTSRPSHRRRSGRILTRSVSRTGELKNMFVPCAGKYIDWEVGQSTAVMVHQDGAHAAGCRHLRASALPCWGGQLNNAVPLGSGNPLVCIRSFRSWSTMRSSWLSAESLTGRTQAAIAMEARVPLNWRAVS